MVNSSRFLTRPAARAACAIFLGILSFLLFRGPVAELIALSSRDKRFAHITLVPLLSIALVLLAKKRIFRDTQSSNLAGIPVLLVGILLWWFYRASLPALSPSNRLSIMALSVILVWTAGFILCFGLKALQQARFALLLLSLAAVPTGLLDAAVLTLQKGSAAAAAALFKLAGTPVVQNGFILSLPGADIEITAECSGIRSYMSLLIVALITGHVFLRTVWKTLCLTLLTAPIVIFTNSLRIITTSWFGIYVDRSFFFGEVHQRGGLVFSGLALVLLGLFLLLFKGGRSLLQDELSL